MEKEIRKVYVDCALRFYTIGQDDDFDAVLTAFNGLDEDGLTRLEEECALATDSEEELWLNVMKRASPEGLFIVRGHFGPEAVCLNLTTAEAVAEKLAQTDYEMLVKVDQALSESWSRIENLKAAMLKLAPAAEDALNELRNVYGEQLEELPDDLDLSLHEDVKNNFISQEADILNILNCINRFRGREANEPTFSYDPADEEHVPYSLPARRRLKLPARRRLK